MCNSIIKIGTQKHFVVFSVLSILHMAAHKLKINFLQD